MQSANFGILTNFTMQIISTIALHNYKVPVMIKTQKNFTFCPGKSQENFINIFQDFKQNSRTFKDFSGQQKNPGLFQDVATLNAGGSLCPHQGDKWSRGTWGEDYYGWGPGESFCAVRGNAENSCSGAFVRTFARTLQNRTRTFVSRYSMLLSGVIGNRILVRERAFVFGSKNATEPNKNIRQSIFFASFGSDRRSYEQNYVTPCIVRLWLHSRILIFQRRRLSKCEKKFS